MFEWRALWLAACLLAAPAVAVTIDGRIDARGMGGSPAHHRLPQGAAAERRARVARRPKPGFSPRRTGLAVAFRNIQPPSVPRTQQRVQRDFEEQVDRVNVMIDFDGDHRTGYDFTISSTDGIYDAIITNEIAVQHGLGRQLAPRRSAATTRAWTVEVLIPWHIAPMRESAGDVRTIGIYVDRVIGATGERVRLAAGELRASALPLRFRADRSDAVQPVAAGVDAVRFEPVRHRRRRQRAGCRHRRVLEAERPDAADRHGESGLRPGGKRRPGRQLRRDRNLHQRQAPVLHREPGHLRVHHALRLQPAALHAPHRRPGRRRQTAAGDIIAALKFNGSLGATKYGVFAADEADAVGRSFGALRLVRDFSHAEPGPDGDQRRASVPRSQGHACSASITTGGRPRAGMCARA